ncbi:MAG: hypothetical protein IJ642_09635 [Oscillospiraceae bacterium]|nr:hypothetical protein [Oscillospiraceae bacterium]
MTNKEKFKNYMLAGHGRCFSLLEHHQEEYRDLILYGCLHDIAFDLQCEDTRSLFIYNLILQYEDYSYFLNPAIQKFLSEEVNTDWHLMHHLTDLLGLFAYDYHEKSAEQALKDKYNQMYEIIMTRRHSLYVHELLQNFEILCTCLLLNSDFDQALQIFQDIGAYFIKKRHVPDEDLHFRFESFWFWTKEKYPVRPLYRQIRKSAGTSGELRRFQRVMYIPEKKYKPGKRRFKPRNQEIQPNPETERISALEILKNHYDEDALAMLISYYQPEDKNILLESLNQVIIDRGDFLGWHHITIEILNQAEKNSAFPDEALFWIYENSQCAYCRHDAVKIMKNRHILTDSIIEECRFDAFEETRKLTEKIF